MRPLMSLLAILPLLNAACADETPSVECQSNPDCQPGEVCRGGACVRVCVTRADCPGDEEICDDGVCVASQATGSCSGVICHADADCVDGGSKRECRCPSGYRGDGTAAGSGCVNIDECDEGSADCVAGATCVDGVPGFACACAAGYQGDGRTGGTGCTDTNECARGTDDCVRVVARCTNTVGGHECACVPGWEGDGRVSGSGCTDIDECTRGTDDCVALADCVDRDGGFNCECAPGYEGDGRTGAGCTDIDECERGTDDCVPGVATCTNTPPGGFTCTCPEGYAGDGRVGGTGCHAMVEGCAAGAVPESFNDNMVGCSGAVTFAQRASLCGAGFLPCTARHWRFELAGSGRAPGHHYWTDDDLLYLANGFSGDCAVTADAAWPNVVDLCSPASPMRVCAPIGDPEAAGGHTDSSGNECNWINCGYETTTPHAYFGGCMTNNTAGTLCCRQGGCADGTVEQTFGADMIGCGGAVTFAERATLCGAGWRVCSAAEWRAHINGFGAAPALHYWTDDDVLWGPLVASGGGSNHCWATTNPVFPDAQSSCSPDRPMRVCTSAGDPDVIGAHVDELGNNCTWIQCGWERFTPHEYWGGCAADPTASALCCR